MTNWNVTPRLSYATHAAEAMARHACADGATGSVATAACPNCGCDYAYCEVCQAADERERPEEDCREITCSCHTDSRHELA